MATGPQAFYCLWQEDRIRESLFELLPNEDICSVRLANSACCNLVTRRLFKRTHLTFTANTFTKSSRIHALSRIGHHIEHLTFYIAHSEATFLPPLIHPLTGREINFLYTPHTCMASVLTRPKYANTELGGILTQQYPPLFHAATNVPSFLNALKHMTNIRHLTIKCPGQDPKERYRRSIVDYALISLRISVERCPLHKLSKLSLSGVHPAAFNYLRHVPGFGSHPSAARRWRQIRKLYVSVDTWDFYGPSPGLDHLKIIDDYVRNMTPHLEKLSFTWLDGHIGNGNGIFPKGPCPVALSGDALFVPFCDGDSKKLFNEITGPMSPLPPAPRREPMQFARLRSLRLRNCTMNTPQLRDLVERHKKMIREFDFENVSLTDGGSYEEAFAELLSQVSDRGSNVWSRSGPSAGDRSRSGIGSRQDSDGASQREGIVPPSGDSRHPHPSHLSHLSFRLATGSHMGSVADDWPTIRHGPAAVATPDDVQLSSPSAAVTAASRELLDIDTDGLENHQSLVSELPFVMNKLSDVFETGHDTQEFLRTPPPPPIHEEDEEEQEEEGETEWREREEDEQDEQEWTHVIPEQRSRDRDEDGLASDIATAQEESLTFTTRLKKKHEKPRRRKHHNHHRHDDRRGRELETRGHDIGRSASRHHQRQRHHQNDRHQQGHGSASRSRSRSRASHGRRHRHHRSRSRKSPLSAASLQADATPRTPPPPVPALVTQHHPSARCASPTAGAVPSQHSPSWLAAIGIVGDHHRVYSLGRKNSSKGGNSHRSVDEEISQPQFAPGAPSPRVASATVAPLNVRAPVLDIDPLPVLLQPAVYDPGTTLSPPASPERKGSYVSSYSVTSSSPVRPPQPLLVRRPSAAAKNGDGLSSVQRHVLQEQQQQQQQQQQKDADDAAAEQRAAQQRRRLMMAEDADARTWALKKAKEAVLAKLSREFQQRMDREATQRSAAATATTAAVAAAAVSGPPLPHGWMGLGSSARSGNNSSSHIMSASAALSLLTGGGGGGGPRLRDRLFGEPLSLVHGSGGGTDGGGSYGLADMPPVSPSMAAAAALDYRYQHHSMESSQSAVVPLIFSLA